MAQDYIRGFIDKVSQVTDSLKNFLSNKTLKDFFPDFAEKIFSKSSTLKKKAPIMLEMTDNAKSNLKGIFANFEMSKVLPGQNLKLQNFSEENHGLLANLIHESEKARFEKLKDNRVLKFVLTVLGSTHANLTAFAEIPDRAFAVTPETFPRLYELYREVHKKLELKKDYHLFCKMDYGRNAKTFGTDDDCIIVIDSACLEDFSDNQIRALLGRELAHIKFRHINYLTAFGLIDSILNLVPVPKILSGVINTAAVSVTKGLLLDWLLAAEFSADRAGAFVAGDILPVIQNNLMICGLETAPSREDYEFYTQTDLPQNNNFELAAKLIMTETLRDFPMPFVIPRIRELAKWGASDECKKFFPSVYYAKSARAKNNPSPVGQSNVLSGQRFDLTKNNPQLRNINVNFEWEQTNLDIEHCAFLLNETGKVASDSDFVFYNNSFHPSGSVSRLPRRNNSARIKIDLAKIPADVIKIAFVLMNCDEKKSSAIRGVSLNISDSQKNLIDISLGNFTVETAIVLGELYRYKGEWKFNAVGAGFSGGIMALCQQFGVDVSD